MPETPSQIHLTKVEQYQSHRSETVLSQENLMALSWKTATQPSLYRKLIPNPYSDDSQKTLSEFFPDVKREDAVKATVLQSLKESMTGNLNNYHAENRSKLCTNKLISLPQLLLGWQNICRNAPKLSGIWQKANKSADKTKKSRPSSG